MDLGACRDQKHLLSKDAELKLHPGKVCLKGSVCMGHLHIQCSLKSSTEQVLSCSVVFISSNASSVSLCYCYGAIVRDLCGSRSPLFSGSN